MPYGADGAISDDKQWLCYTPYTRNARTWKRYRGGEAQDIWVGDPEKADFRKVTEFDGTDAYPMWHGGRIFFLSDQGGTANIWSMNPDGSDRIRHTDEPCRGTIDSEEHD